MNRDEALQHALGYAAGREDASGVRTAQMPGDDRGGFIQYAAAYAEAWDYYNKELRGYMTTAKDAYDTWQQTSGYTIFRDETAVELSGDLAFARTYGPDPGGYVSRKGYRAYLGMARIREARKG